MKRIIKARAKKSSFFIFIKLFLSFINSKTISKPLAPNKGIVIAKRTYIIEGTLNFEKKGKRLKKGLYKIGKKDPNPVINVSAVITQKTIIFLSGFFKSAPKIEKTRAINPR
tara:strand:+ start:4196 stop:4531 length:336 start_codon:yes stop_codon:yes gene_type:complete